MIEEVPQPLQIEVPLRRSIKERRSTISDDYVVYLQEHEFDTRLESDPLSFHQGKQSPNLEKWIKAMNEEMKAIEDNGVWDLVEFPIRAKLLIGCK